MASYSNMDEFSVEQLMALNDLINSDSDNEIDEMVEKILADKNYRVSPKDKGKSPFEGERQFIDEYDRDMEVKKPRRLPLNYKGRRGIMPTWKYSERQKAKALLVEEAYQSLLSKGAEGLPPTMGGRWRTDDPQVNAEMKRIENVRKPKRPRGRPPKPKTEKEVKILKKRGRPPKPNTEKEVKTPKKRGRPPKPKTDAEVKIPKKRGRPPKAKRQTVAERFLSQKMVKLLVPANSVITTTGPGKFTISVDLNRRPTRKAPEVPKGVAPWKPVPKPRTTLPRERPVPKPRTILLRERPVPKPRTPKPKLRKHVKVSREVEKQPTVITPDKQEIDPFGTYLNKPPHRKIETAANGAAVTYSITPQYMDPLDQMTASRQVVRGILVNELKRMGGLKYTETIKVRMSKEIGNSKTKKDSIYFKSKTGTATNFDDIESTAAQNQLTILSRIETFQNLGSNWIILNIESHYINIAMYKPLKGSSYITLPRDISNPKCGLINMKNNDNKCFMWSHVRHLRPKIRRATTITHKDLKFADNLDYSGIEFPVKISDIDKIERKNSISISVFGYGGKKEFYPIKNSKTKYDEHMELLLLGNTKGNNHYVLIKDVNRMLFSVSGNSNKKHFCLYCLHSCASKETLKKHKETCIEVNGTQATKLPEEGTKLKFKHHRNSMPVPFVIYADFESILVPEERKVDSKDCEDKSSTDLYQTHKACSFGLKTVCHYDDKYSGEYMSYIGEDAALVFLKTVLKESLKCRDMVNKIFKKKMVITPEQEAEFWMTRNCSICGNDLGDDRVRDHDHVTGMYRGAAHNMCNLKYRITWKVPVIFHNLRGYDSHLIMQEIGKFKMNINVIPNNMEKYISFSLGKNLVFIDSIQFMASSLEALVSNLSPEDFKIVGKRWKGKDFDLVTQKGVFPYEFLDDISKLDTEGLPSRDKFYSTLYESEVKEEDYQRALKVWDHFKMKTMKDYHDLYLETDVLLLADVFENFRRTCLENYKLDPAHYMSAPGLSWDAFLKQSGEEIELVSDMDMFQFFEKGMRGGVSHIAHRHSEANNKYMETYDETLENKYLMYLDANNLYGWAMSQPLPNGEFEWVEEIDNININDYLEDSDRGMVLEVDLDYPKELHNLHNGYPLAPESKEIDKSMLSDYAKKIAEKFQLTIGGVRKLVNSLGPKKNYVLHVRNLKLYTDLGMKLTKVHRAVTFKQSPWLKNYIDFNTKKRSVARNMFEKDFFKLMNNSIYGKTMENLRKRVDVKLVSTKDDLLKLTASPCFQSHRIMNENLIVVKRMKEVLTLNKPCYVGMSILDLSKTLMYDFHYNTIKKEYGNRSKLLFTDTDSLMYEIRTDDVYEDFKRIGTEKDCWDNSDYPKDSPYYSTHNKKVIGKFKDEAEGVPVVEFVGLRSKMYSYVKENGGGGMTAKGVKKYVIRNKLTHENFKNVINTKGRMRHNMNTIRSKKHTIGTYEMRKVTLSCFDDKRYLLEDGVTSYAYGHHTIGKTDIEKVIEEKPGPCWIIVKVKLESELSVPVQCYKLKTQKQK